MSSRLEDRISRLERKTQSMSDFIAYRVGPYNMALRPGPNRRDWIDQTNQSFGNRCLPMLIANQAGWEICLDRVVRAVWDGGQGLEAIKVEEAGSPPCALSHFGHGILTFSLPYLFRTPPSISLLFRGPANQPKDSIQAMEGLVETEWAVATATMNWKFTRPQAWVQFNPGDPICFVVPQQMGLLEGLQPRIKHINDDPPTMGGYQAWNESRLHFNAGLHNVKPTATKQQLWERHYFQGTSPSGVKAKNHRTQLKLREFKGNAAT